eukprot:CAMPEP_0185033688 /NCGR_PEP_ID=MMETSP1103-20130426/22885_1 /TAXON_ID=36769 /ORGANISM="Paraphysomonas bandaiensis, Strain Caron Lab Isolate" /LENGTH=1465 /DNA_ID=CAMNT_0027570057 /DNA_START=361 /DNA_END=4758 /DNA_ORIENTATION=+
MQLVANKVESSTIDDILDRLSYIERENEKRSKFDDRLSRVESSLENLQSTIDNLVAESKETRREMARFSTQINSHSTAIEVLQHDVDSRRSTISKFDSWVRQGEQWRTDIEGQLSDIAANNKMVKRVLAENKSTLSERVTKDDLENLRDRVNISTQQTVAASLAAWHDKVELSVRQLERQVAAIRLGTTISDSATGGSLTDEEVKKALMTQQPSEILLKGVVSSEVRSMETDLENKIQLHMMANLRSHVYEANKEAKDDLKQYLKQLVSHMGGIMQEGVISVSKEVGETKDGDFDSETALAIARHNAMVKEKDREFRNMVDRLEDLSSVIISIQESMEAKEKTSTIEYRALERKLEECVSMSSAYVSTIQNRASDLERYVQDSENNQKIRHSQLRDEMLDRMTEISQMTSTERAELEKRMIVVEKVVESVVDRVDMSKNVFDGLFAASPEIKRFQTSAVKLEGLLVEFTSLRSDVRELESSVGKVQGTVAKKDEISELRERLSHVEPLGRQVDELSVAQQKIQDEVFSAKSSLVSVNSAVDTLKTNYLTTTERISKTESTISNLSREMREANDALDRKLSSKIMACEETVHTNNSSLQNSIQQIHSSISSVSSNLSTTTGSVSVLQEKVETLQSTAKEHRTMISKNEMAILHNQKELNNIQHQVSKVQMETESKTAGIKDLKKQISNIDDRVEVIRGKQEEMTSSNQQLTQQKLDDRFSTRTSSHTYSQERLTKSSRPMSLPFKTESQDSAPESWGHSLMDTRGHTSDVATLEGDHSLNIPSGGNTSKKTVSEASPPMSKRNISDSSFDIPSLEGDSEKSTSVKSHSPSRTIGSTDSSPHSIRVAGDSGFDVSTLGDERSANIVEPLDTVGSQISGKRSPLVKSQNTSDSSFYIPTLGGDDNSTVDSPGKQSFSKESNDVSDSSFNIPTLDANADMQFHSSAESSPQKVTSQTSVTDKDYTRDVYDSDSSAASTPTKSHLHSPAASGPFKQKSPEISNDNDGVMQFDDLSSAGSTPLKPSHPSKPITSGTDFMSNLENSFDDSMDASAFSPLKSDSAAVDVHKNDSRVEPHRNSFPSSPGRIESPVTSPRRDDSVDDINTSEDNKVLSFSMVSSADERNKVISSDDSDTDPHHHTEPRMLRPSPSGSESNSVKSIETIESDVRMTNMSEVRGTASANTSNVKLEKTEPITMVDSPQSSNDISNSNIDDGSDWDDDSDDNDDDTVPEISQKSESDDEVGYKSSSKAISSSSESDIDENDEQLMSGNKSPRSSPIKESNPDEKPMDLSGLSIRERLQLRQEALRKEREGERAPVSSFTSAVATNADVDANASSDSDESVDIGDISFSSSESSQENSPQKADIVKPGMSSATQHATNTTERDKSFDSDISTDDTNQKSTITSAQPSLSTTSQDSTAQPFGAVVTKKYGVRSFESDEDEEDEVIGKSADDDQGDDMVMSFGDDDFDDEF